VRRVGGIARAAIRGPAGTSITVTPQVPDLGHQVCRAPARGFAAAPAPKVTKGHSKRPVSFRVGQAMTDSDRKTRAVGQGGGSFRASAPAPARFRRLGFGRLRALPASHGAARRAAHRTLRPERARTGMPRLTRELGCGLSASAFSPSSTTGQTAGRAPPPVHGPRLPRLCELNYRPLPATTATSPIFAAPISRGHASPSQSVLRQILDRYLAAGTRSLLPAGRIVNFRPPCAGDRGP